MNSENDKEFFWGAGQTAIRIVFVILFCIGVPYFILNMQIFYRRINTYPIKDRTPRLVLLGDTFLLLFYVITCVRAWNLKTFPCWLFYWSRLFFNAFCLSIYIVRILYVLYKYRLTVELAGEWTRSTLMDKRRQEEEIKRQQKASQQMHKDMPQIKVQPITNSGRHIDRVGWYSRHRYLLKERNIAIIMCVITTTFAIPGIILYIIDSSFDEVESGRCLHGDGDDYTTILLFMCIVFFMILAWRIREVMEGYRLIFEFKMTSVSVLLCFVIWQIIKRVQSFFPFHFITSLGLVLSVMIWSTVYPIYLSRKHQSDNLMLASQDDVMRVLGTVQGVLQHNEMKELFKEHLCKEFSVENLFFLDETERWEKRVLEAQGIKDHKSQDRLRKNNSISQSETKRPLSRGQKINHQAMRSVSKTIKKMERENYELWNQALFLYEHFIKSGAPYEINLPYVLRSSVADTLEACRSNKNSLNHDQPRQLQTTSSTLYMADLSFAELNPADLPPVPVNLFHKVNKSIIDLLQRDSFPRFVQTSECQTILREIRRAKKLERQYSQIDKIIIK